MKSPLLVFLSQVPLPGNEPNLDVEFLSGRVILSYQIKSLSILKPDKIFLVAEEKKDVYLKDARPGLIKLTEAEASIKSVKEELGKNDREVNLLLLSSDLVPRTPAILVDILEEHLRARNDLTLVGERTGEDSAAEDYYIYSGLAVLKIGKASSWPARLEFFTKKRQVDVVSLVEAADKAGMKIGFKWLGPEEAGEFIVIGGLTDLLSASEIIRKAKVQELLKKGVFILAPDQVWISPEVKIGSGTVIYPFVYLEGETRLGKNCQVYPHCHIINSRLGNGVKIFDATVIEDCRLEDEVQVGPFARLRPGTYLRRGCRVGNFVEMKKTRLGRGSKAMHLTYLGDATVGDGVNIGAGTITCNYDGVTKHRTYIGPGAFIGSGTELVAPVKVGRGAYVAAGSTITEDVSPEALAIARARQVEKPGWVKKRKKELSRKKASSKTGK